MASSTEKIGADFKLYGVGGKKSPVQKLALLDPTPKVARKQPKYLVTKVAADSVKNDLKLIVSTVHDGQRTNIDDFTKGHLNERKLQPLQPANLGDKINRRWDGSTEKKQPVKTPKKKGDEQYSQMTFALQELVTHTGGVTHLLANPEPDKPTSRPDDELAPLRGSPTTQDQFDDLTSRSSRSGKTSQYRKINKHEGALVEEMGNTNLKLPRLVPPTFPSESPKPPNSPGVSKFHSTHLFGATKKDQFAGMIGFQNSVLNFPDTRECKLVSGNLAAKRLEDKLHRLLTSLPSKIYKSPEPSMQKVAVHSKILSDLIKDSPILGPALAVIKTEYDEYLGRLVNLEKQETSSLQSEVTMLTGVNSGIDPLEVIHHETQIADLEDQYEQLLNTNRELHEQLKDKRSEELSAPSDASSILGGAIHPEDDQATRLQKLRRQIEDVAEEKEQLTRQVKESMVPSTLTSKIRQLTKQDERDCEKLKKMCDVVIDATTEAGKQLNAHFARGVISPLEVKLIWRKLKQINTITRYCGRPSDQILADMKITDQDIQSAIDPPRPDSSRREDFDFYF